MSSSRLALGTVQFGLDYGISNQRGQIPPAEAAAILDRASASGIDVLDTAANYGSSEEVIGRYLRAHQGRFKIVSKLPSVKTVREAIAQLEKSLKRLGVKKLYGYLLHDFETVKRSPEIVRALARDERIEKVGFSLYYPDQLKYLAEKKLPFDLVQVPYSIFDQRFRPTFSRLRQSGREIHVRSVFLQGLVFQPPNQLSGALTRAGPKLKLLREIARENKIGLAEICLKFALANRLIDRVVIGVESLAGLEDNIKAVRNKTDFSSVLAQLRLLREDDEEIILPMNWKK